MARSRTLIIRCPKCGSKVEYEVFDVIDAQRDQFVKNEILGNRFFNFECGGCGDTLVLTYDTVYRDEVMDTDVFMIDKDQMEGFFTALALVERLDCEELSNSLEEAGCEVESCAQCARQRRIVTNYDDFKEKIMILEEAYDDRIVELVKIICLIDGNRNFPDANFTCARFCLNDMREAVIELTGETDEIACCEFPTDLYATMEEDFIDKLPDREAFIIDANWASKILDDDENGEEHEDDQRVFDITMIETDSEEENE